METETLDWQCLTRRLGSPNLALTILQNLLTHHRETPGELLRCRDKNALPRLTELAHQLRGAAQYLSAERTQRAAKALEEDLKNTATIDPAKVEALHTALLDLLSAAERLTTSAG